jgi:predicted Zn-dependent peptidase
VNKRSFHLTLNCKYIFSWIWIAVLCYSGSAEAQTPGYKLLYSNVPNDAYQTSVYQLANGLTVYLSANKREPSIYTATAVRAGSKHDPATSTGLAHYLEHMLFKGTDKMGTIDFQNESQYINEIQRLYRLYNQTVDPQKRTSIYRAIDSVSNIAAKYAVSNEFDKIMGDLGASGVNAFTSNDQTVYIGQIPSNRLEAWVAIEAERYRKPVMRLFHTELETVYEEKNISLDNEEDRIEDSLNLAVFPSHPYGTQTTIGTIEHLKNPSLDAIQAFFDKYYVPNNMALCLSGDLNIEETIKLIDRYFSSWQPKVVEEPKFPDQPEITKPIVMRFSGTDPPIVSMRYRLPGYGNRDALVAYVISNLLYNSSAGLLDLDLEATGKVQLAQSKLDFTRDYSTLSMYGKPNAGQSLEAVHELLLSQLQRIAKGDFSKDLLAGVIRQHKLQEATKQSSNSSRVYDFMFSYTRKVEWPDDVKYWQQIENITLQDVIRVAQQYLKENNYAVVFKTEGPKDPLPEVEKPQITPVKINRDAESAFSKQIKQIPASAIEPAFVEFEKPFLTLSSPNNLPIDYIANTNNDLCVFSWNISASPLVDKALGLALKHLSFFNATNQTYAQFQSQLYLNGCSFYPSMSQDNVQLMIRGLSSQFESCISLTSSFFNQVTLDKKGLQLIIEKELIEREDNLKDKDFITNQLRAYGDFGPQNPSKMIFTNSQLKKLQAEQLTAAIKEMFQFPHRGQFWGSISSVQLGRTLDKYHIVPTNRKPAAELPPLKALSADEATIYFVDYPMVQANIRWVRPLGSLQQDKYPHLQLYNEYFSGNMGSIVFQEIRESKALAYSVHGGFRLPRRQSEPLIYGAFVGTQADKVPEALSSMNELINNLPQNERYLTSARTSILNQIAAERIQDFDVFDYYERNKKLGLTEDPRKKTYQMGGRLTIDDLVQFQSNAVRNKPFNLLILADKSKVTPAMLKPFGKVKYLSLQDLFGY